MIWRLVSDLILRLRMASWQLIYRGLRSRYDIDSAFRFNGVGIQLYGDGRIAAGADSYIGEFSTVQAGAGRSVSIGRRCRISHNVRIYTATARADADFLLDDVPSIEGDVTIGDGAWIGTNVYIGPGISIGANAVVGANSAVTRSVPPSEIWGGVPARLIRRKTELSS